MNGIALRVSNTNTSTTGFYSADRFFQECINRISKGKDMSYSSNIIVDKNLLKCIDSIILFKKCGSVCNAYLITDFDLDYNKERVSDRLQLKIRNCKELPKEELNSFNMLGSSLSVGEYLFDVIKKENRFYWYS